MHFTHGRENNTNLTKEKGNSEKGEQVRKCYSVKLDSLMSYGMRLSREDQHQM